MLKSAAMFNTIQQSPANAPTIKVGSTHIKPIINTPALPPPQPVVISQPPIMKSEPMDMNKMMAKGASQAVAMTAPPPPPPVIPIPAPVTLPPPSASLTAPTMPSSTSTASTNATTASVSIKFDRNTLDTNQF